MAFIKQSYIHSFTIYAHTLVETTSIRERYGLISFEKLFVEGLVNYNTFVNISLHLLCNLQFSLQMSFYTSAKR